MSEEDFLEFSGQDIAANLTALAPDEIEPDLLNVTTKLVEDVLNSTIATITTTKAPTVPYEPNIMHIVALSVKCFLVLLVCTLSCTIRRDFLRNFVIFLMVPLFLESAFDVFTVIHVGTASFGIVPFEWSIYEYPTLEDPNNWTSQAVDIYSQILEKYTTYRLYTEDVIFPLVSFFLADYLFWSVITLLPIVYYYSHRAVVRPEDTPYSSLTYSQPKACDEVAPYVKAQLFPLVFSFLETVIQEVKKTDIWPEWNREILLVYIILKLFVFFAVLTTVIQFFASFIVLCKSKDELSTVSPYEQIRNSKKRLVYLMIFSVVVQLLNVPYLVWSCITASETTLKLIGYDVSLPLQLASDMYPVHLHLFLLRPFILLVSILAFVNPYTRKFLRFFCPCATSK